MNDDYTKEPHSITELRCERSGNADDRTVRDTLVNALRDVDKGEHKGRQYALTVIAGVDEKGSTYVSYYQNAPNRFILRGIIEELKVRLDT